MNELESAVALDAAARKRRLSARNRIGARPASVFGARVVVHSLFPAAGVFGLNFGLAIQLSVTVVFLQATLHIGAWDQSWLEAVRETCGIAAFFVVGLFHGKSEPRTTALMSMLVGAGFILFPLIGSLTHAALLSLVWSLGFHAWRRCPIPCSWAWPRPAKRGVF